MYVCLSVYMYAYTFIYTHMWVYICTHVGAFCLNILSNLSTTCVCITGAFPTPVYVCGSGLEVGGFPACFMVVSWLALVARVGGYVLAGVDIRGLS